jgi:hypothetical protein
MTACGAELKIKYFDNWPEGMTEFRKSVLEAACRAPMGLAPKQGRVSGPVKMRERELPKWAETASGSARSAA